MWRPRDSERGEGVGGGLIEFRKKQITKTLMKIILFINKTNLKN